MVFSIKHLFHMNASRTKVCDAISTVEGVSQWWTTGTSGSGAQGGVLAFSFGGHAAMKARVEKLVPGELVVWQMTEGPEDWVGTTLTFALDENDGKTRVRFEHGGWNANGDHYAACCFSWGRYMESLRQLCQTGTGEGFGTANYRL